MQRTATLLFLIALSFLLKKWGILKNEARGVLGNLYTTVIFPALVISSYANLERDLALLWVILIGLGAGLIMLAVMLLLNRKESREAKAFVAVNCSSINVGAFAFPFLQGYLTPVQLLPVLLFDLGNGIMAFSGSAVAGQTVLIGKPGDSLRAGIKQIVTCVPVWAYLLSLLLYATGWSLPQPVYDAAGLIAGASPILAMVIIGLTLDFPKRPGLLRWLGKLLAIHYGTVLLLALLCYLLLPYSHTIRAILIILMISPLGMAGLIHTERLGLDRDSAGLLNTITILIGVAAVVILVPRIGL